MVHCILQLLYSPLSSISSSEKTPKCSGSGRWAPIPFGPRSKGSCLCCGSCGRPLDVQRALGQPVACWDGLPQTSLSRQLTCFPRVPQCQRPAESVSANTCGGEAGKMFRFIPDSQTRAAKQWLGGNVSNCVLSSDNPTSQSLRFFFFSVHMCVCMSVYLSGWELIFIIWAGCESCASSICAQTSADLVGPSYHGGLSTEVDSARVGVIKVPARCSAGKASPHVQEAKLTGFRHLILQKFLPAVLWCEGV